MAGPWEDYASKPWEDYGTPKATPEPAAREEGPGTKILGGGLEPLLAMGTGAAGQVAGGIAGLGQMVNRGLGLTSDKRAPGDVVQSVAGSMTYEPKTQAGRDAMTAIGYPFKKFGEFSEESGGRLTDVLSRAGAPPQIAAGAGAAGNAAMQFLPQFLGAKGAGAATEAAPSFMPRITPKPSAAVEKITDLGGKLTPGQVLGGGWDRWEQAMAKWPIVGAPIRGARQRAFESVDQAAYNDVLAPVNQRLPSTVKPGHDAIVYMEGKLGARYEDILSRTKGSLDGTGQPAIAAPGAAPTAALTSFRQDLQGLRTLIDQSKLPDNLKGEFGRIVDEDIIGRFEKSGIASGETVKEIDSQLRTLAQKKKRSDDRDVNKLGQAIQEARSSLKRMVERENPGLAADLKATDAAWSKFKVVQKATTYAGKEGIFTPEQFERAVKAQDPSKSKAQYARGKANMQELAAAAREAIGDAIPDTGTPSQFLAAALTESLTGRKMGILGVPGGLAAGAALSLPYSELGTGALQKMLTGQPVPGAPFARTLPFGMGGPPQQQQ